MVGVGDLVLQGEVVIVQRHALTMNNMDASEELQVREAGEAACDSLQRLTSG